MYTCDIMIIMYACVLYVECKNKKELACSHNVKECTNKGMLASINSHKTKLVNKILRNVILKAYEQLKHSCDMNHTQANWYTHVHVQS